MASPARTSSTLPRHAKRLSTTRGGRRRRVLLAVPLAVAVLATAAWGVDTAAGGDVVRNVEVAGRPVGEMDEAELRADIEALADDLTSRTVRLVTSQGELQTTASELGLTLDVDATVERVLDAGRGPMVLRPVEWVRSFVSPHDVDPVISADVDAAYNTIIGLEGANRVPPIEPSMALEDGELVAIPGAPGSGIDVNAVAARLPAAALAGADPIVLTVEPTALAPATTDEQVQAIVDEGNLITDVPLTVEVAGETTEVSPEEQRAWLRLEAPLGEAPSLGLDEEAAVHDLAERFPDLSTPAVNATVTLNDAGAPVVVPGANGTGCCEEGAGDVLLSVMRDGAGSVELETTTQQPEISTEEAESWQIREPVGGVRAWPENRSGEVGPGFTTFHAAGEPRVINIHRIADIVRGAVIPPGGTFSVNEFVGERTSANGFVPAGAIRNGQFVDEVGGGVSQFATTLFNAAYFAGLDIPEYQAHSQYFSRYPRGREATMGFPAPDLVIENTTPFGILIWTSYTDSSLTVTMWSSPFVVAEQTDIDEGSSGNCDVVVTERTRTYPDGSQVTDEFRATYRPGEGRFC